MIKKYKKASGDVFNAKGDVFNASGDVFNAKGDVFNASGDVFNADGNPLPGKTEEEVMLGWRSGSISDQDYYSWLDYKETAKPESSGFMKWADWVFGKADQATEIINKYKSGTSVEDEGVDYEIQAGDAATKPNNTIWYVAGGIVIILIGVAVYMKTKKKG